MTETIDEIMPPEITAAEDGISPRLTDGGDNTRSVLCQKQIGIYLFSAGNGGLKTTAVRQVANFAQSIDITFAKLRVKSFFPQQC